MAALIAIALVGGVLSSVILRADAYQKLLPIETGNFAEEVDQLSFDEILCWIATAPPVWVPSWVN